MTPRLLGAVALGLALWSMPAAAADYCPRQPMPAVLDTVRPPESVYVTRLISFSARPSLQSPEESWVVRVYTETVFEEDRREREVLEIVRLRGEYDCNRWFVTGRWQSELAPGEVAGIYESVVPFLEPAAQALTAGGRMPPPDELTIDGTGIAVEASGFNWTLRRKGNAADASGEPVSERFHALAARLVPPEEMPARDWRRQGWPED